MGRATHCPSIPPCRSRSIIVPRRCTPTPRSFAFDARESPRCRCAGELRPRRHPSSSVRFQGHHLTVPVRHSLGGASMSTLLWICCWRATPSSVVRAQHVHGRRDHGPPLRGVGRAKSGRSGSVTGPGQATCTVRVGRQRDFGPFSIKNRKSFFYFYSFSIQFKHWKFISICPKLKKL
jgi:hypothetical protein